MDKPLRTTGYHEPDPSKIQAITIKVIKGTSIRTIPIGTKFEVSYIHKYHSVSHGLGITDIWNDEYELIEEIKNV